MCRGPSQDPRFNDHRRHANIVHVDSGYDQPCMLAARHASGQASKKGCRLHDGDLVLTSADRHAACIPKEMGTTSEKAAPVYVADIA